MSQFNFKYFSPLRTPDVIKAKKKKKAKVQFQHNESDGNETDVTKDLRILVSSVKENTENQADHSDGFGCSDLIPDIDKISVPKLRLLDSRMTCKKEQSPQKHQTSKEEHSDGFGSSGVIPDLEKIPAAKIRLLDSRLTRKKSQSPQKHQKSKEVIESRNTREKGLNYISSDENKAGVISTPTDCTNSIAMTSQGSGSPKKKNKRKSSLTVLSTDSPTKKSKKIVRQPSHEVSCSDSDNSNKDTSHMKERLRPHSDSSESENSDNDQSQKVEPLTSHAFRYKRTGFEKDSLQVTNSQLGIEDIQGKELWLIKAPVDFDMSLLCNKELELNEEKPVCTKSGDVSYDVLVTNQSSSTMSAFCPLLPSHQTKDPHPATNLVGRIDLVPSVDVPPLPEIEIPPPVTHSLPKGLHPRFTPFGSDIPVSQKSKSGLKRKHKKHKEEKLDESSTPKKKKSKKHKK